ncbi:hypothetical protein A2U01_0076152, partial [Trifolium medium]|nr:hypothetical protein [Trifolium medium]
MDSDVDYPGLILKGNKSSSESKMVSKNSIPLSFYTTTLVYHPATAPMGESKMDIFVPIQENNHHPLSFYMDPTVSHP